MTKSPIIKKIKSLKKFSVFSDWAAKSDTPEFKSENLIYGLNRSGKTTLSRIFTSLGLGAFSTHLPQDGAFSIELTDGTTITTEKNLEALKDRVVFFNEDFIAENFRWKDRTANPVFYIGKEQAELASVWWPPNLCCLTIKGVILMRSIFVNCYQNCQNKFIPTKRQR